MAKDSKGHGSSAKGSGERKSVWDRASPAQRAKWASQGPSKGTYAVTAEMHRKAHPNPTLRGYAKVISNKGQKTP